MMQKNQQLLNRNPKIQNRKAMDKDTRNREVSSDLPKETDIAEKTWVLSLSLSLSLFAETKALFGLVAIEQERSIGLWVNTIADALRRRFMKFTLFNGHLGHHKISNL